MIINGFDTKKKVLIVAEIGNNHEGNFNYAKKLTKLAIKSGADVVKFQLYSGDGIVNKNISPDMEFKYKDLIFKCKWNLSGEKDLCFLCLWELSTISITFTL